MTAGRNPSELGPIIRKRLPGTLICINRE